jgi:hypothetical protein
MNMDLDFAALRRMDLVAKGYTRDGYTTVKNTILSEEGDWLYTSVIHTPQDRYFLIHFTWNTETDDYDFFNEIDFGAPLSADFAPREVFPVAKQELVWVTDYE